MSGSQKCIMSLDFMFVNKNALDKYLKWGCSLVANGAVAEVVWYPRGYQMKDAWLPLAADWVGSLKWFKKLSGKLERNFTFYNKGRNRNF